MSLEDELGNVPEECRNGQVKPINWHSVDPLGSTYLACPLEQRGVDECLYCEKKQYKFSWQPTDVIYKCTYEENK